MLAENYHSEIVERLKADDFTYRAGRLTIHLAREFGFCYGVDRAVDYAYQTRRRFPDRAVHLTGEIIHNPHVNDKLRAMGVQFLSDSPGLIERLQPEDVVILPAFGVTVAILRQLERRGCTLVDTTCGSVLNVWKNVRRYAEGGYTSVIHGKVWHEETQATASQAVEVRRAAFSSCSTIAKRPSSASYVRRGGDRGAFLARFRDAVSPGFDPERDLQRIGLANQTTMLMSESLDIGEMLNAAMLERYGEQDRAAHFQAFDTICSATQDRQDAVVDPAPRHAGRSDGRDRGLQQQQHLQSGADVCSVASHVPHRRSRLSGVGRQDSSPAGGRQVRGDDRKLASSRTVVDGPDRWRLDARQPGGRDHCQARSILRLMAKS